MSYQGYTKIVSKYLSLIDHPTVLEIGVDRGQTSLPLVHNLSTKHENFKWVGIDVRRDSCLAEQFSQLDKIKILTGNKMNLSDLDWHVAYLNANSLDIVPSFAAAGLKFDLIMIDGDHNYDTVSKELSCVNKLAWDSTLVLVDDYKGRWAEEDMHYVDRQSHSDITLLDREKKEGKGVGVKAAVDDWLEKEKNWTLINHNLDCVILHRDCLSVKIFAESDYIRDCSVYVEPQAKSSTSRFRADIMKEFTSGDRIGIK